MAESKDIYQYSNHASLFDFFVDCTDKYHCVYSKTCVTSTSLEDYFVRNRQVHGLNMFLFTFPTLELNLRLDLNRFQYVYITILNVILLFESGVGITLFPLLSIIEQTNSTIDVIWENVTLLSNKTNCSSFWTVCYEWYMCLQWKSVEDNQWFYSSKGPSKCITKVMDNDKNVYLKYVRMYV